jgi:hypothetical protein
MVESPAITAVVVVPTRSIAEESRCSTRGGIHNTPLREGNETPAAALLPLLVRAL